MAKHNLRLIVSRSRGYYFAALLSQIIFFSIGAAESELGSLALLSEAGSDVGARSRLLIAGRFEEVRFAVILAHLGALKCAIMQINHISVGARARCKFGGELILPAH